MLPGMALPFSSESPWGLVEMIVLTTRRDKQVLDDKSLAVMVSVMMTTLQVTLVALGAPDIVAARRKQAAELAAHRARYSELGC
jgi:hypothetical protein